MGHRRGKAAGVAVEKEKQGFPVQQLGALLDEGIDMGLKPEHLPVGPPAIGGRIHDDAMIGPSPALFPAYKFQTVIHQIPDGGVFEAAEPGVVLEMCIRDRPTGCGARPFIGGTSG